MNIHRITSPDDIHTVARLARAIWTQHYVPIIGRAQVDYMLERFQSAGSIARQIADGYEYYLVSDAGTAIGYTALVPDPNDSRALLSKIYVQDTHRGRGIGKAIIAFVKARCVELGLKELWLTVNRNNTASIAFYRKMGFTQTETILQDIGNGFVLDDYKMVMPCRDDP